MGLSSTANTIGGTQRINVAKTLLYTEFYCTAVGQKRDPI